MNFYGTANNITGKVFYFQSDSFVNLCVFVPLW